MSERQSSSTSKAPGGESRTADVVVEHDDGVAWITLNRPERLNAMNESLMDGLVDVLSEAAADPSVRCVVLTGSGSSFCAGGDVALMSDRHRGTSIEGIGPRIDGQVSDLDRRFRSIELLVTMPKPTVAMVRGWALGGGLCLALACDLRFAADDAKFGHGFLARGVSGNFGIAFLLARTLGPAGARAFAFLHESVPAQQALTLGLVHAVESSAELESFTRQTCQRLAVGPTFAYGKFKDSLNFATDADLQRIMHYEAMNSRMTSLSQDARESVAALKESRSPRFLGH